MKSVTNLNSDVYYHGQYWNDVPPIAKYISKILTGDENKWWIANFKEKHGQIPFNHALFLNCGDGRWEREFIDRKIVKKVTAFDVSPELIEKAKKNKGSRKIKYIIADANKVKFKKNSFDMIVNIAALHHVQYINRLCRQLANSITPNGVFINHDFVGPSRNQYPLFNYFLIRLVNHLLPKNVKKSPIGYPPLPTMLVADPTEAIHANLIERSVKRYFNIFDKKVVGGGIAYEIFTHNNNFVSKKKYSNKDLKIISAVLTIDSLLTKAKIVPSFFSYFLCRPNKQALNDKRRNDRYQNAENKREKYSSMLYNTYTLKDYAILWVFTNSWRKRLEMIFRLFSTYFHV